MRFKQWLLQEVQTPPYLTKFYTDSINKFKEMEKQLRSFPSILKKAIEIEEFFYSRGRSKLEHLWDDLPYKIRNMHFVKKDYSNKPYSDEVKDTLDYSRMDGIQPGEVNKSMEGLLAYQGTARSNLSEFQQSFHKLFGQAQHEGEKGTFLDNFIEEIEYETDELEELGMSPSEAV